MKLNGQDLFRLADTLRQAGRVHLSRQLDKGVRRAGAVMAERIEATTDRYMPAGYEATFRQAVKIAVQVRFAHGRRVSVIGTAMGRQYQRHVDDMDAGILKHPVHGRYRRGRRGRRIPNPWVVQRIRRGWFSEPGRQAEPDAVQAVHDAAQAVADQIEKAS